jgi:hypothetical protein
MLKTLKFILILVSLSISVSAQNILSPEEYFGNKIGDKFNFHYQLIDYHKYLASMKPNNVKIIPLGTTNEGRPQLIVAIGSEENIKNIENIRQSNLQNIGLLPGSGNKNIPVIAMLSYNVHGNESVNAQTAVFVAHELIKGESELSKKVLKNTLVLIDPCVNPDGFDRYSQWYNRYKGITPDLNLASVEHHEPWPGGRFNHYLFDLNRDLAWQTQKETQQRIKFYNEWMPHLHADFHEMGPNSTYYFPPSSKPFHEDITPYQREFQEILGQYNSKRFDKNGWLYFTKENYDLLYPSYGDTYPTYNGAIAMTFEQGGSGAAGLAYLRRDGDTLTLKDRIMHSYSTSLGTLEAISDKSQKTIEEFISFFKNTEKNGKGVFKSFVLKNKGNEDKVQALMAHLDRLQIKYTKANKKQDYVGFSYSSKKEEKFSLESNDLIINTFQPKGVFVKILFEPSTFVEDSLTYDITAWSLPYAYGIPAFGLSQKIEGGEALNDKIEGVNEDAYAYAVPWKSFENARFLADLFKNKIKVRIHETPFKASGVTFSPGTLLITKKGNEGLGLEFGKKVLAIAKKHNQKIIPLVSGLVEKGSDLGSSSVSYLKAPNVAMLIGTGVSPTAAGDVWHFFEQQLSYPITLIDGLYFSSVDLWKFDVLILPSGRYNAIIKDHKEITRWVSDGGKLILMESANSFFAGKDGLSLKSKSFETKNNADKKYGDREREEIANQIPGAIYKVSLDNTHPLAFGYEKDAYILIKNTINYEKLENGWNIGKLTENAWMSGFVGSNAKINLQNSPVFSVQNLGNGSVVYLLESPIFRGFWYDGKLLMANAAFLVN